MEKSPSNFDNFILPKIKEGGKSRYVIQLLQKDENRHCAQLSSFFIISFQSFASIFQQNDQHVSHLQSDG